MQIFIWASSSSSLASTCFDLRPEGLKIRNTKKYTMPYILVNKSLSQEQNIPVCIFACDYLGSHFTATPFAVQLEYGESDAAHRPASVQFVYSYSFFEKKSL